MLSLTSVIGNKHLVAPLMTVATGDLSINVRKNGYKVMDI